MKISVRTGNYLLDLEEQMQLDLHDPKGWEVVHIPNEPWGSPHRCFMLQIAILSNHQQGRDSHLRQIKILSPAEQVMLSSPLLPFVAQHPPVKANKTAEASNAPFVGILPTSLPKNRWILR